jgi:anti-sigma-K factor RskA
VTDPRPGHARFDELAAGYAVHALDPSEELIFLGHVEQCGRCQRALADYGDLTAAMADLAPDAEPSPQLAARIMAAAASDLASDDQRAGSPSAAPAPPDEPQGQPGERPPARVRPRRSHRGRLARMAVAAAAAVVIAAGGIWGGLAVTGGHARPPLAACARAHECSVVVLTASASHRTAAKVIVRDGVVWMEPAAMAANPAGKIYVLWQITGAHVPLAVGSFDIRPGAHAPVRIGILAVPYRGTWAFAVSLEQGRTIPPRPSRPVALGQVPA